MPIYEYECSSCGQRFEKRQKFTDDPVAECAVCGSPSRRILLPAGIIFKGSGWYKTDSRGSDSSSIPSSTSNSSTGDSSATKSDEAKTPASTSSDS